MFIRTDIQGNILLASLLEVVDTVFCEFVPIDFMELFPMGKYLFISGEIVEVEGWIRPPIKIF